MTQRPSLAEQNEYASRLSRLNWLNRREEAQELRDLIELRHGVNVLFDVEVLAATGKFNEHFSP